MKNKSYRFEIPAQTGYRNYTVSQTVTDLDPDGFVADAGTGDEIIEAIAESNDLVLGGWDTYGAGGAERMLVWDSEEAAQNDDGQRAMCQITRTPVEDAE